MVLKEKIQEDILKDRVIQNLCKQYGIPFVQSFEELKENFEMFNKGRKESKQIQYGPTTYTLAAYHGYLYDDGKNAIQDKLYDELSKDTRIKPKLKELYKAYQEGQKTPHYTAQVKIWRIFSDNGDMQVSEELVMGINEARNKDESTLEKFIEEKKLELRK